MHIAWVKMIKMKKVKRLLNFKIGNNVFLYFTEWIKLQYPTTWYNWFDTHISSFFAVAAPLLGSPQTIRGAVST